MKRANIGSGGFFAQALRLALPCFAACAAAVLAHVAIDIAGDYVLAKDAYDALDHGSRFGVSLLALAAAAGGLWAIIRAALAEARGSHGALRAVLRAAAPSSPVRFLGIVALFSVPVLLGMAGLDAAVAGKPVDDLGDLLGGSFVLAGSMLALCAGLVSAAVLGFLRLLCRYHRTLVRVLEAFVRLALAFASAADPAGARREPGRPRTHASLRRCTSGNRAPPLLA